MHVKQINGRIAIVTNELDEFGESYACERMISLETARCMRNDLDNVIKECESIAGSENDEHVGTD